MVMAAAMAAARAAARTPVSAATRIVQRRLGTSSTGRKDDADNVDIINRAVALAKSTGGKKVLFSLGITVGVGSFIHWTASSYTAYGKNETDRRLAEENEFNKSFQIQLEKELQQLERDCDSFLDDNSSMFSRWGVMIDEELDVLKRSDTESIAKGWVAEWMSTIKKASLAIDDCSTDFELLPDACSVCGHPRTDTPGTLKTSAQSPAPPVVQSP
ncbi:uncharacterized protein LOC124702352 [Lolium rigidum]|uniref:uncharacterized protein LOC124702352 n=1 Tax=Lolium rigidum TaxID=89674 RepID=UPI001F5DE085|nr:uncharacterized protein LOC124702352 [Lolium rigidum]